MKTKILFALIAVIMCFSMANTAFAFEQRMPVPAAVDSNSPNAEYGKPDAILDGLAKGTSLPTSSWDLNDNDYNADLQVVGKSWLYTNRYFYPNGNGRIYVDYDVASDSSTTYLYIGLYDLTSDSLVVEHTAIEVRSSGKTGSMYFYNLVQSHKYAVCFRAHPQSLHGSAVISH